jgi:hypothetical protein
MLIRRLVERQTTRRFDALDFRNLDTGHARVDRDRRRADSDGNGSERTLDHLGLQFAE